MITVIPTNPGSTLTQLIKDFQEVDLCQTASTKPFPDDLFVTVDGEVPKDSIKGNFLVQIVSIELANPLNDDQTFLLTLTDGIRPFPALTNGSIENLKSNAKIGSKLLLTDRIPIHDGVLQLNCENTQFHFGSNTYPRPRSAYRGRSTYRNGGVSSRSNFDGRRQTNHRYENDDNENNFGKRPPPKTTLIDFMPQLKNSLDIENEKGKERNGKRRTNTSETSKDQIVYEQDNFNDENADNEDDPTHVAFRERRNPLPPRLQRVQEERSRRNPIRGNDEIALFNGIYHTDSNGISYLTTNSSGHNPFVQHPSLIGQINGTTTTSVAFYPANPSSYQNHLPYGLTQGYSYGTTTGAAAAASPHYFANATILNNGNNLENSTSIDNEEKLKISGQNDENTDQTKTFLDQQNSSEEKRSRPRWKIGDFCLARWNEDGEFYYATILQIQPPFCEILFTEYNTHDKVHFNDMKIVPRDQHFYQYYPQSLVPTSEYNPYVANGCYPVGFDGCLIMPEVPPFPFNSDGTLYMCPTPLTSFPRSTRSTHQQRRQDQNSPSTIKDDEFSELSASLSKAKPCSIADSPLILVTAADLQANQSKDDIQGEEN